MSTTYDVREGADATPGVTAAVEAIRRGELVVLPTDTVYGLAADAFSPAAVKALLECKGRGPDMPVPVLVGSLATLSGLADDVTPQVQELTELFWPGGLTLVVRQAPSLLWQLGETRGTVAVRMPLQAAALAVLERTGPLAVSSANRSGMPAALDAAEAARQLGTVVPVYLDGGSLVDVGGTASTILDCTGDTPRLLRAGAVTEEALREVLPDLLGLS